jgi:2-C-methyl-D-erythritol 4-phosphate cytidylyltransferase
MAAGATPRTLGSRSIAPRWEGWQVGEATAIVLSGGSGSRFHGSFIPKQFAEIEGKPILAYCLDTYEALPAVDEVVLIINDRYEQLYYDICSTYGYLKVRKVVPGGQTRQESVARGLEAIDPCGIVVVQDGVRPFSSEKSIIEAIEAARLYGAADVVVPTLDTIVEERDGFIVRIPDRTNLRNGYAPQAFRYDLLVRAHQHARATGMSAATDDAQLVLAVGGKVRCVEGSFEGFKVTTYVDWLFAQQVLEARRSGRL